MSRETQGANQLFSCEGAPVNLLASPSRSPAEGSSAWSMWDVPGPVGALPVTALALVSNREAQCYCNSSSFSMEAMVLHEYFSKGLDAYTVKVEDVRTCKEVQSLLHKQSRHRGQGL